MWSLILSLAPASPMLDELSSHLEQTEGPFRMAWIQGQGFVWRAGVVCRLGEGFGCAESKEAPSSHDAQLPPLGEVPPSMERWRSWSHPAPVDARSSAGQPDLLVVRTFDDTYRLALSQPGGWRLTDLVVHGNRFDGARVSDATQLAGQPAKLVETSVWSGGSGGGVSTESLFVVGAEGQILATIPRSGQGEGGPLWLDGTKQAAGTYQGVRASIVAAQLHLTFEAYAYGPEGRTPLPEADRDAGLYVLRGTYRMADGELVRSEERR